MALCDIMNNTGPILFEKLKGVGVDSLAQSLVHLIEKNHMTLKTLTTFIAREVNSCTDVATLFRSNDISRYVS